MIVPTFALDGPVAHPSAASCALLRRLPAVVVVGLPGVTARETTERLRASLTFCGWEWPRQRVELAVERAGDASTAMDLPLAVALLVASEQLDPTRIAGLAFYGELSFLGHVHDQRGTVAAAQAASAAGQVLVTGPGQSADLAAHLGLPVVVMRSLGELREGVPPRHHPDPPVYPHRTLDFGGLRGDPSPLMISSLVRAARTRAPLLFVGPPGCGKTMIASRLGGLLPDPTDEENQGIGARFDAVGLAPVLGLFRPFRAPHHTISTTGLCGSPKLENPDVPPRLGEVDLAQDGVLFLDALIEWPRATLQLLGHRLREPGRRVWLVAATDPILVEDRTSHAWLLRLIESLDIDPIWVTVPRVPHDELRTWPSTAALRANVESA